MKTLAILFLLTFLTVFKTESFRLPPPPPHLMRPKTHSEINDLDRVDRVDIMPHMLKADLNKIINAMINSIPPHNPEKKPTKVPLITGKFMLYGKETNQTTNIYLKYIHQFNSRLQIYSLLTLLMQLLTLGQQNCYKDY